ncbi:hypothetical protein [Coleofasciculus chthonoplastes]|uniref:hypothetical protein n=1 Tax=Coleofasciculus chthonoplastes TaxID=64178 RepID=UPI0032F0E121
MEQQNPPSSPIMEQQNPPSSPITEQPNPPYSQPRSHQKNVGKNWEIRELVRLNIGTGRVL